jgi:hypothetical protein
MVRVAIFGYYNKKNWGDNVFEYVLKKYIFCDNESILDIKNVDTLKDTDLECYDKILIGCGDIVNDYFLSEENTCILSKCSKPVIFLGFGIQYSSHLYALDVGDCFITRNKNDFKTIQARFGNNCSYIPDLANFLVNEPSILPNTVISPKSIGICIPYTWMCDNDSRSRILFGKVCNLITSLQDKYTVTFIPFDTSSNPKNSDLVLTQRLSDQGIHVPVATTNTVSDMIDTYNKVDVIIGGRFHSVILAIIMAKPFIALTSTTKMFNLHKEAPESLRQFFIKMIHNDSNQPVSIPDTVVSALSTIEKHYSIIKSHLSDWNDTYKLYNENSKDIIIQAVEHCVKRISPPIFINNTDRQKLLVNVLCNTLKTLGNNSINDTNKLLKFGDLSSFLPRGNLDNVRKKVTEEVLWTITGDPYAPYYYGLSSEMFTGLFTEKIKWLIDDYYKNYYYNTPISIINRNFQNIHRSGWQYVVNSLVQCNFKSDIILDTYVDKTFHWNNSFYKIKGVIPYTSAWIGVIHHTFSDYVNSYNCTELFKQETFLKSLEHCKSLIVMSQTLAYQMKERLEALQIPVRIDVLTHPTQDPEMKFDFYQYSINKEKKLVHIGNWLRNMFTIYEILVPDQTWIHTKSILKNKNSDNYFVPDNLFEKLLLTGDEPDETFDMCRTTFTNLHMKGLYDCIYRMETSVEVIECLSNDKYDALLSNNIVFLNYIDASATNTLIECIVRNTPVIVNKIPAVVELLGENYPLYYTSMHSITKLLEKENEYLVEQAHVYLTNLPKERYSINNFIKEFGSILKGIQ